MAYLRSWVENLKLPMSSVEADLAQRQEEEPAAKSTEAWLVALRQNLSRTSQNESGTSKGRSRLAASL